MKLPIWEKWKNLLQFMLANIHKKEVKAQGMVLQKWTMEFISNGRYAKIYKIPLDHILRCVLAFENIHYSDSPLPTLNKNTSNQNKHYIYTALDPFDWSKAYCKWVLDSPINVKQKFVFRIIGVAWCIKKEFCGTS